MTLFRSLHTAFLALILSCLSSGIASATQITIANQDGTNEGFNDPTVVSPVGGNTGTTIGEQRLKVFEYAAKIWGSVVDSNIEVIVDARFDSLTCSMYSAVLGSAGTTTVHRNFPNAPFSNTWYPSALANSLSGSDRNSSTAEIDATFNNLIDNNDNCLINTNWYYGLDGNRPANTIELLSVVMHEIGHGLGFQTFVNTSTGEKFLSRNDAFMLNLEDHSPGVNDTWDQLSDSQRAASAIDAPDLHWNGIAVTNKTGDYTSGINNGHIRMYAPDPLEGGSSVSHFSKTLSPNELMEPSDTGPKTGPGLARELMIDIGWDTFPNSKPFSSSFVDGDVLEGDTITVDFVIGDNDTNLSSLTLGGSSSNTLLVENTDISFSGSGRTRTLQITALSGNTGTTTISVSVDDGTTIAIETFDLTVLFNNPPVISIQSPADNSAYLISDSINFQATASDSEDGNLAGSIQWNSSLDGAIGTGASFSTTTLSQGVHTITASVIDTLGKNNSEFISVTVTPPGDSDADGMDDAWELLYFGNLNRDGTDDYDTDGLTDATEEQLTTNPILDDTDSDGVTDGDEVNNYNIDPLTSNRGDVGPRHASDNLLTVSDLVVLTRLVTGAITDPSPLESILGNLNGDSEINAADLLLLQQLLLTAP